MGKPGKDRGFRDREVTHRLVKVGSRGGLHPVGVGTQINFVEVQVQDVGLGVGIFNAPGKKNLFDLAGDLLVAGEQEVSGHLLGDGGRALGHFPFREVTQHGPNDAEVVDATMLPERGIFCSDEGMLNMLGDGVQAHDVAALFIDFAQDLAVPILNHRDRGGTIGLKRVHGRQALAEEQIAPAGDQAHQENAETSHRTKREGDRGHERDRPLLWAGAL